MNLPIDLHLRADSAEFSRRFYVQEVGLFTAGSVSFHGKSCMIVSLGYQEFRIYLDAYFRTPPTTPIFSIEVDDWENIHARLRHMTFESGGRYFPYKDGERTSCQGRHKKAFMLEDPSGNRFLVSDKEQMVNL